MSDARISTGLPTHPKTKKLLRRLGPAGPWALVCLFLWARDNRADGDLSGMTDEDIELAADWSGDEGAFVAALVSVGFVDGDECARSIHDWSEHQPWSAGADDRKQSSAWAALCKRYGRDGAAERMPEYAARMRKATIPAADSVRHACDPHTPRTEPHATPTDPQCPATPQCPASVSVSVSVTDTTSKDDSLTGIVIDPSGPKTGEPDSGDDLPKDLLGVKPAKRGKQVAIPCPAQEILDLWDRVLCPEAAAVVEWNDSRARTLAARWKDRAAIEGWQSKADGLKWFEDLFAECRRSRFLMGKVPPKHGSLPFKLKFDWFFGPENFVRVLEGDFHRGN